MKRPINASGHPRRCAGNTAMGGQTSKTTADDSNDYRKYSRECPPLSTPASTSDRYDTLLMARALSDMLACALDEVTRECDAVNAARVAPLVRAAITLRRQVWALPTLSPDDGRASA